MRRLTHCCNFGGCATQTFLAGKPVFAVDELEIWCVGVWGEV